jgi:hypothetical protein
MSKRINPLEEAFNIQPGTSLSSGTYDASYIPEPDPMDATANAVQPYVDQTIPPPKDNEDAEIFSKLDNIHLKAMEAFNNQTELIEIVDPKFAARNAEVAAQYLTAALNAVNLMSRVKNDREKRRPVGQPTGPSTVNNNNIIVTDRNSILKMLLQQGTDGEIIQGEK